MNFVTELYFACFVFLIIFADEGFLMPSSIEEILQNTQTSNIQKFDTILFNKSQNESTKRADFGSNVTDCIYNTRNLDELTQNQFIKLLTSDCRYDRLSKPDTPANEPLNITLRMDIRHIELLDQVQFRIDAIIQYRYVDNRLAFDHISPNRPPVLGRDIVKNRIWIPHLVIAHEKEVKVMGLAGQDVFVFISPQGEVSYGFRISIILYCWMDLRKFPFDKQICRVNFQSWTYNASTLMLYWEEGDAIKVSSQLYLTEFHLEKYWINQSLIPPPIQAATFGGKYSGLEFKFKVAREAGYYLMDYFIPSIMLVSTSWVTFWLRADNGAPRTTLGTATMLSFITLASGQSKNLPKVSYIKISEIWFLGCSIFIFASMVEFAFVNLIWRRKKAVEMKKVNSKYILKGTLTPSLVRKEFQQSDSCDSGIDCSNCIENGPVVMIHNPDSCASSKSDSINGNSTQTNQGKTWTTMTPHEIANWIDTRSRIIFPVAFLIFNICFWTYVLSVSVIE